ncbi:glutathione S-transferase family protein [Phyllobacterium meliloti]|uniref:glutathione S-transferase family protein n=1 Tax=Phyllobacterium meliloti TaxID=555317 RepID=UPI001D14FB16|nr:glutathione S-transferase [Phyllobacterium sp. T1293]UGX86375.1 glutathione S-transferase [Phyllobacterium sp. T1293]
MLKVWGRRNSFNVQKVLWLVGELGLPHEHIPAGGSFGQLDSPEFRAMNPHGRVPVIEDAGQIVWESHAILRYLAARFGENLLWSGDAGQRADWDHWMDWSQTSLQPAFLTDVFWGFYRTPEKQRDWSIIKRGIALCTRHFQLLDHWLAGKDYMLGENFSLADITVGTTLYRYFNLEIQRPDLPNVEVWYQRLQQRQPYRDHVMIPFDDLYGRLDF